MKLKDARELVRAKTIEDMEVDICALVVSEEFSRKVSHFEEKIDYRTRAVERPVRMKEAFTTDWNI
ncbi:MAG TPA: hypothetical protein DGH68_01800, partial [Bacteroidetes bacterium]|nr:hypothetical protein [Bacteroidota bacterium]